MVISVDIHPEHAKPYLVMVMAAYVVDTIMALNWTFQMEACDPSEC